MITRKMIIIGNWKMHLNVHQSSLLLHRLTQHIKTNRNIEVVLAPSNLVLQPLSLEIDRRRFKLAAQNAYFIDEGAYTGEVSFAMLKDLASYCIIGHSERRRYFNEDHKTIQAKVAACIRNDIRPVLCIGENRQEKTEGETRRVLHDQLTTAIANLTAAEIATMVVAYEPVWAISSGNDYAHHEVADPIDVDKIGHFIRSVISDLYGTTTAETMRLIYGGSSNAENAASYLSLANIDGLLPGGASLNYLEFSTMVNLCEQVAALKAKRNDT